MLRKFHREEGERQGDGIKYKLKTWGCEVRERIHLQVSRLPRGLGGRVVCVGIRVCARAYALAHVHVATHVGEVEKASGGGDGEAGREEKRGAMDKGV